MYVSTVDIIHWKNHYANLATNDSRSINRLRSVSRISRMSNRANFRGNKDDSTRFIIDSSIRFPSKVEFERNEGEASAYNTRFRENIWGGVRFEKGIEILRVRGNEIAPETWKRTKFIAPIYLFKRWKLLSSEISAISYRRGKKKKKKKKKKGYSMDNYRKIITSWTIKG